MDIELLDENDGRFEYSVPTTDEFAEELVVIFEVTPDQTGETSPDVRVFLSDEDGVNVEIPFGVIDHEVTPHLFAAEVAVSAMVEAEMNDRFMDRDDGFDGWGGV